MQYLAFYDICTFLSLSLQLYPKQILKKFLTLKPKKLCPLHWVFSSVPLL